MKSGVQIKPESPFKSAGICNQQSSIDFLNHVVDKFPFRIKMIRTDNGHEFQSKFHWHADDLGLIHVYIKPGTPRLNGKVECSHLTDKKEFYQLLDYTDDVDLKKKLNQWEDYYYSMSREVVEFTQTPWYWARKVVLGNGCMKKAALEAPKKLLPHQSNWDFSPKKATKTLSSAIA